MADARNPFSDLIPSGNNQANSSQMGNPFADLVPARGASAAPAAPVAVAPELPQLTPQPPKSVLSYIGDAANMLSVPHQAVKLAKNVAVGMGNAGQNIATTLTGGYAPTVPMEETLGVDDSNRSEITQGIGQYAPLIAAGPMGFVGDAAAGLLYGASQSPDDPLLGGAVTGASNAGFGLLNTALGASKSPIISGLLRSIIGAGSGYMLGGKEGAAAGSVAGLVAPAAMRRLGFTRDLGKDIVNMTDQAETAETSEAGLRLNTPLSPGEASGRPDVAGMEASLGRTGPAATTRVEIGNERIAQQRAATERLKSEIAPESKDASVAIRQAARDHIAELEATRAKETDPYYKQARTEEIPQAELDELLKIPRVKSTYRDVLEDPDYLRELGGEQPTGKHMIAMIENRIDGLITDARSKPYNSPRVEELEYAKSNLTRDYGDPRVQEVLKEIYKNDPVFHATVNGVNPRSIEVLDLVKKKINIDAENQASAMNAKGTDKFKAGLISKSADAITSITDQYSPSYAKARQIHADMTPLIEDTKNGVLGRIANMSDIQLKNASKMIFDPSQTNLRVLSAIKKGIMRRDPDAWNSIVRNEITRLNKKGDVNGTNFYRNTLANENQFKQFELALDHNPKALQTLRDMKKAWKNLINFQTPKTAANNERLAMNTKREFLGGMIDMINEVTSGKEHAAALKYIYSPKWNADYANIKATANKNAKQNQMAIMFAKILPPTALTNLMAPEPKDKE